MIATGDRDDDIERYEAWLGLHRVGTIGVRPGQIYADYQARFDATPRTVYAAELPPQVEVTLLGADERVIHLRAATAALYAAAASGSRAGSISGPLSLFVCDRKASPGNGPQKDAHGLTEGHSAQATRSWLNSLHPTGFVPVKDVAAHVEALLAALAAAREFAVERITRIAAAEAALRGDQEGDPR